jgi:hypothetical protein
MIETTMVRLYLIVLLVVVRSVAGADQAGSVVGCCARIYTLTIEAEARIHKTIPDIRVTAGESRDLKNIAFKLAGCFAPGVMCDNFWLGPPILHGEASVGIPFNCGIDADGGGVRCKPSDPAGHSRRMDGIGLCQCRILSEPASG